MEKTGNLLYRESQFLFCCSTWIIVYLATWQVSGSVLETICNICLSFLQTVACFFSSHSIKRCKYHEVLPSCFSLKGYREPSSSWSAHKQMWILKTLREIYLLRSGNWVPAGCLMSNHSSTPNISFVILCAYSKLLVVLIDYLHQIRLCTNHLNA